jgi:hypothetical protein
MINNYTGMEVSLTMAVLASYHAIVTMVNSSAHVLKLVQCLSLMYGIEIIIVLLLLITIPIAWYLYRM